MNERFNEPLVDKIARALLYEGYALYPYRPCVKSRQRWTFGGIYPPQWTRAQDGADPCIMQTQCLLKTTSAASLRIRIRFLHLVDRTIGQLVSPVDELPAHGEPDFRCVQSMDVGEKNYQAWQEAIEREVDLGEINAQELLAVTRNETFSFSHQRRIEPLRVLKSPIVALLIRRQETIEGAVEVSASVMEQDLLKITVRISNLTKMNDNASAPHRDQSLLRAFVSTHTVLETKNAAFISLTDPPSSWQQHARQCANIGTWPVLIGQPGESSTMLSSPIIVEDYPKIAPESPGDLFDATEIDEILTLRIMTLTDEEKRIAAGMDDRVRVMLERTQLLARDELMGLHGSLRAVESLPPELVCGDAGASPLKKVLAHGVEMKAGDSVRLRPLGRADVMDLALDGKMATIVSIEQDFENRLYVAVTVDDDPGKDLGLRGQPGHRFFFGIEEVEPVRRTEAAV